MFATEMSTIITMQNSALKNMGITLFTKESRSSPRLIELVIVQMVVKADAAVLHSGLLQSYTGGSR